VWQELRDCILTKAIDIKAEEKNAFRARENLCQWIEKAWLMSRNWAES
jgi:hypothetical protein